MLQWCCSKRAKLPPRAAAQGQAAALSQLFHVLRLIFLTYKKPLMPSIKLYFAYFLVFNSMTSLLFIFYNPTCAEPDVTFFVLRLLLFYMETNSSKKVTKLMSAWKSTGQVSSWVPKYSPNKKADKFLRHVYIVRCWETWGSKCLCQ